MSFFFPLVSVSLIASVFPPVNGGSDVENVNSCSQSRKSARCENKISSFSFNSHAVGPNSLRFSHSALIIRIFVFFLHAVIA